MEGVQCDFCHRVQKGFKGFSNVDGSIEKDNRIPPLGYNKAAYQADGAFIIPEDTYADGQNWDITNYSFTVPATASGAVQVTATLYYQTFSKEYVDFLRENDQEPTVKDGGRARNLPDAGIYSDAGTWGNALHHTWDASNKGQPVKMVATTVVVPVQ